jgi:hypothetical protein
MQPDALYSAHERHKHKRTRDKGKHESRSGAADPRPSEALPVTAAGECSFHEGWLFSADSDGVLRAWALSASLGTADLACEESTVRSGLCVAVAEGFEDVRHSASRAVRRGVARHGAAGRGAAWRGAAWHGVWRCAALPFRAAARHATC